MASLSVRLIRGYFILSDLFYIVLVAYLRGQKKSKKPVGILLFWSCFTKRAYYINPIRSCYIVLVAYLRRQKPENGWRSLVLGLVLLGGLVSYQIIS